MFIYKKFLKIYRRIPLSAHLKFRIRMAALKWSFIANKVNLKLGDNEVFHARSRSNLLDGFFYDDSQIHILVMDVTTPMPDRDAGSLTLFYYLKAITELGYKVTFVPSDFAYCEKYTKDLMDLGVNVVTNYNYESVSKFIEDYAHYFSISLLYRYHLADYFYNILKMYNPDLKIIFDTVDLHFLREMRQAKLSGNPGDIKKAERTKFVELNLIKKADATIILSHEELDILKAENITDKLKVIPLLLELPESIAGFDERQGVAFVGNYNHAPNVDALDYFLSEIWPGVATELPGIKFYVIGPYLSDNMVHRIQKLTNVVHLGFVENLEECLNGIRVMVAPLRFGAGIKGKIGSSLANGVPCIASTIAAEGMKLSHGEDIMVADKPIDYISGIREVYENRDVWNSLSAAGIRFSQSNYSYEHGKHKLNVLLNEVLNNSCK